MPVRYPAVPSIAGSVLAVVLCWASPAASQITVADMDRARAGQSEPVLDGEWLTIEAPGNGLLQSFRVPAHNGRVLMGLVNNTVPRNLGIGEQRIRMASRFVKVASYQLYLDLLALGENKEVLTQENLGQLYTSRRNRGTTMAGAAPWPDLFIWAARGGLSDDSYRDAFCSDAVPCPIDVYKGPRPFQLGTHRQGEAKLIWGNATNEFEFQAAYEHFMNTYAQPLVDWGVTIPREVASVGQARMSQYDFTLGAYQFQLSAGPNAMLPEGQPLEVSTPEYDLTIRLDSGSRRINGVSVAWKLDREAAEALRNTMTERQVNGFFVLTTGTLGFEAIDRAAMNSPLALERNAQMIFTGGEFVLYFDAELTEEAARFSVR